MKVLSCLFICRALLRCSSAWRKKRSLEEWNEWMSSSRKRWEHSRFSSLWWRNNTTPDYGWSPGVEKRYILAVWRCCWQLWQEASCGWTLLWVRKSPATGRKRCMAEGQVSSRHFPNLKPFFAEEFEAHQTIYFTNLGTKQNLGSVFLYPVFVGDSRGFVIEFNSCFVLAQEKSIERAH